MARYNPNTPEVETIFGDGGPQVATTPTVAAAFGIEDSEARAYADEIGVARIGYYYCWTPADVVELAELLDEESDEDLEGDESDPDLEDPDED